MSQQESHLNISTSQLDNSQSNTNLPKNPTNHIYIQEENSKGRFIPNLLMLNKLHSKVDSTNNTLLGHMCSYNSPLLPLYIDSLPYNDEVLNKKNSFGNSPLDIAGLYCNMKIINLLKAKGAVDNGGVDYWAIRGGNLQNWSGSAPLDRKQLIHWAAYNDLPQVLEQYYKKGANLQEPDMNGSTPIEITLVNKSYKAFDYLLSIGLNINEEKVRTMKSKSLNMLYDKYKKKSSLKVGSFVYFIIYLYLHYFLFSEALYLMLILPIFFQYLQLYLDIDPNIKSDETNRVYNFRSKLLNKRIQWGSNHHTYVILNLSCSLIGILTLYFSVIDGYLRAVVYWIMLVITITFLSNLFVQLLSISANLTYFELFETHKAKHLFKRIQVVEQLKLVYHVFKNPYNLGLVQNWKQYLNRI